MHTLTVTPLPASPWLGRTVTDHEGQTGTVRRVYAVGTIPVAILTGHRTDTSTHDPTIWEAPVDVLSTAKTPARVPDYRALLDERASLEVRVVMSQATDDEETRHRALSDCIRPYTDALACLSETLHIQIEAGDRVLLFTQGLYATVLDPDPDGFRDDSPVSPRMRVRLDERHLRERPALREQYPDGVVVVTTPFLWPTLGLL